MSCQTLMKHARLLNNVPRRFETTSRNSGLVKRDHHHQIYHLLPRRLRKLKIPRFHPNGASNSGMEAIQSQVPPSLPRHRYHRQHPRRSFRRFHHRSPQHSQESSGVSLTLGPVLFHRWRPLRHLPLHNNHRCTAQVQMSLPSPKKKSRIALAVIHPKPQRRS